MNPVFLNIIKKLSKWLLGSFDVSKQGGSAKKLTAFAFMVLVVWLHWKFVTVENVFEFLVVDVSALLTLLGVATIDKIQQIKRNQNDNDQPGQSQG